jgi:hypothetical protein
MEDRVEIITVDADNVDEQRFFSTRASPRRRGIAASWPGCGSGLQKG